MGLYDAMKDAVNLAQKADNIELYRQLLDLSSQALDLQAEVAKLREENNELKRKQDISKKIIRHEEPCITIEGDDLSLYYCSHCWDSEQMLIQLNCKTNGTFECSHCHTKGNYDNDKKRKYDKAQIEAMSKMNRVIKSPYLE